MIRLDALFTRAVKILGGETALENRRNAPLKSRSAPLAHPYRELGKSWRPPAAVSFKKMIIDGKVVTFRDLEHDEFVTALSSWVRKMNPDDAKTSSFRLLQVTSSGYYGTLADRPLATFTLSDDVQEMSEAILRELQSQRDDCFVVEAEYRAHGVFPIFPFYFRGM